MKTAANFLLLSLALLLHSCSDDSADGDDKSTDSQTESTSNSSQSNNDQVEATLDATLTIGDTTYYAVAAFELPTSAPSQPYRYQINFGTKAQSEMTEGEPAQHSTVGLVMSFKERPKEMATYAFTDSRGLIEAARINLYVTHWINKGTPRDGKNYISPSNGEVQVHIEEGKLSASIPKITMRNEADASDDYELSGNFNLVWP